MRTSQLPSNRFARSDNAGWACAPIEHSSDRHAVMPLRTTCLPHADDEYLIGISGSVSTPLAPTGGFHECGCPH